VINIDEAPEVPPTVKPFFQELGARVDVFPVMILEDLGAGLQQRYG
jgi:hypothetical protein